MANIGVLYMFSALVIGGGYSLIHDLCDIIPVTLDINNTYNKYISIDNANTVLFHSYTTYTIKKYYSETHRIGAVMDAGVEIVHDSPTLVYREVFILISYNTRAIINSRYKDRLNGDVERETVVLEWNYMEQLYKEVKYRFEDLNIYPLIGSRNSNILLYKHMGKLYFYTRISSGNILIGNVIYGDVILCDVPENLIKRTVEVKQNTNDILDITIVSYYNNGIVERKQYRCGKPSCDNYECETRGIKQSLQY